MVRATANTNKAKGTKMEDLNTTNVMNALKAGALGHVSNSAAELTVRQTQCLALLKTLVKSAVGNDSAAVVKQRWGLAGKELVVLTEADGNNGRRVRAMHCIGPRGSVRYRTMPYSWETRKPCWKRGTLAHGIVDVIVRNNGFVTFGTC